VKNIDELYTKDPDTQIWTRAKDAGSESEPGAYKPQDYIFDYEAGVYNLRNLTSGELKTSTTIGETKKSTAVGETKKSTTFGETKKSTTSVGPNKTTSFAGSTTSAVSKVSVAPSRKSVAKDKWFIKRKRMHPKQSG
jgi:hypothetical protein